VVRPRIAPIATIGEQHAQYVALCVEVHARNVAGPANEHLRMINVTNSPSTLPTQLRKIKSAAFSATIMVGTFVFPLGTRGMMDASTTRKPSSP
jgi:hypothetical protein